MKRREKKTADFPPASPLRLPPTPSPSSLPFHKVYWSPEKQRHKWQRQKTLNFLHCEIFFPAQTKSAHEERRTTFFQCSWRSHCGKANIRQGTCVCVCALYISSGRDSTLISGMSIRKRTHTHTDKHTDTQRERGL